MNKKYILIIIGLVLLLALGWLVYFKRADIFPNKEMEKKQSTTPISYERTDKDLSCVTIIDQAEREECFQKFNQLLNRDKSACETITDEQDKKICLNGYSTQEAAAAGDPDKCPAGNISCRTQVLISLAIKTKDKKYCEEISNKLDKENCLNFLK